MSETNRHKGLTFNNEISVGNVLTGLVIIGAIGAGWFDLDKRASLNAANIAHQSQRTSELNKRIDDRLNQIDRKLDVIVERQIDKN